MADIYGVEIFDVGTWVGSYGPMKWSFEDMQEIVLNTNALMTDGKLKPKLKFGHSDEQFWESAEVLEGQDDGDPSIGKVINFRLKGTKVIADLVGLPDIVYSAIDQELYTNVSAEVVFIQNFGWFVSAVALLGADPPAVKTLSDLQAYLSELSVQTPDFVPGTRLTFSETYFIGGEMPEHVGDKKKTGDNSSQAPLTNEAISAILKQNQDVLQQFTESQGVIADLKKKLEDGGKELSKYKKANVEVLFNAKFSEIIAPYEKDVTDGLLMPACLDKIKEHLNKQKAGFTAEGTLGLTPELAREVAMSYKEKLPGISSASDDDSGSNDDDKAPDETYVREIKAAMNQNPKLTYSEAAKYVGDVKPEVLKKYVAWTEKVSAKGKPGAI